MPTESIIAKLKLIGLNQPPVEHGDGPRYATFWQHDGKPFEVRVASFAGLEIGAEYGVMLQPIKSR